MTRSDAAPRDNTCRLFLDHAGEGGWNMAVDELLLERASVEGQTSLRLYGWSAPTLSLGYFQSHTDRETHAPSRDCAMVRRRSGGGAILHDHEITYALAMPIRGRWGSDAEALYRTVHTAVIGLLNQIGCAARLHEGSVSDAAFLCFDRRAPGDVVYGEYKLMGSAQRRSQAALLQHGSLLLTRSKHAPTLAGVFDVAHETTPIEKLELVLAAEILTALGLKRQHEELSTAERERVDTINRERFSAENWTQRR